jgi:hypothetical protein
MHSVLLAQVFMSAGHTLGHWGFRLLPLDSSRREVLSKFIPMMEYVAVHTSITQSRHAGNGSTHTPEWLALADAQGNHRPTKPGIQGRIPAVFLEPLPPES